MGIWWLSFVDPDRPEGQRFLGVALVEADDYPSAIRQAWRTKCNPGGEIQGTELPLDRLPNEKRVLLARAPRNTLLQKADLEHYGLL